MVWRVIEAESETLGVFIRKKESVKISETDWMENMNSKGCLTINMVSKEDSVIEAKTLTIDIQYDKNLAAALSIMVKGENIVEGSALVGIVKPIMNGFNDMSYNNASLCKLLNGRIAGIISCTNKLESSPYKQEEFFKNHLENGYVTVEVISEICVNREKVEDKELKRKEAVIKDINRFCSDKSSSDFLVICQGEEIPCHRIILCSR